MEKDMTHKIVEFNFKVHKESEILEATVKAELHGLREELERERSERVANDQALLNSVT